MNTNTNTNTNTKYRPIRMADEEFGKCGVHNLSLVSFNAIDSRSFKDYKNLKNFQMKNYRYPQPYRNLPDFIPYHTTLNVSDDKYLNNPLARPLNTPYESAVMSEQFAQRNINNIKSMYSWINEISKDLNG
jgi:hypothetical protein